MTHTKDLIRKAFDQGKLRYPPEQLDFTKGLVSLELRRTAFTGTEFGYDPDTDGIVYAWRSIDGFDLEVDEFLAELEQAVNG